MKRSRSGDYHWRSLRQGRGKRHSLVASFQRNDSSPVSAGSRATLKARPTMTCGERCAKPDALASHGQIQAGVVELVVSLSGDDDPSQSVRITATEERETGMAGRCADRQRPVLWFRLVGGRVFNQKSKKLIRCGRVGLPLKLGNRELLSPLSLSAVNSLFFPVARFLAYTLLVH